MHAYRENGCDNIEGVRLRGLDTSISAFGKLVHFGACEAGLECDDPSACKAG